MPKEKADRPAGRGVDFDMEKRSIVRRFKYVAAVVGIPLFLLVITVFRSPETFLHYDNMVADYGANGLQIERCKEFREMLGPYSRFRWHHPGPILFYIYAWLDVLNPWCSGHGASLFAQLLLNVLCLLWLSHLVYMQGLGTSASLGFGLVTLYAVTRADGTAFVNTWAPLAVQTPLALTVVSAASLMSGRIGSVLPLAWGWTICVQNQIGLLPLTTPAVFGALVALVMALRHRLREEALRHRLVLLLTLVLSVLFWLPPLIQEFASDDGNFRAIVAFFRQHSSRPQGWRTVFAQVPNIICAFSGVPPTGPWSLRVAAWTLATISALGIPLVAIFARGFIQKLAIVTGVSLCLCVASWRSIVGDIKPYFLYPLNILYAMALGILWWVVVGFVRERFGGARFFRRIAAVGAVLLLLGGAWVLVNRQQPMRGMGMERFSYIDDIVGFIAPRAGITYQMDWRSGSRHHSQWTTATGIAYALTRRGYDYCIPDGWQFMFGSDASHAERTHLQRILLFNADVKEAELGAFPYEVLRSSAFGPSRVFLVALPKENLPLTIRHNSGSGYFGSFYPAEDTMRWSRGRKSSVSFRLSDASFREDEPVVLSLTLSSEIGRQMVELKFNSRFLASVSVDVSPSTSTFPLALGQLKAGVPNVLEIGVPSARRLEKGDGRVLGVAFRELRIMPAPTNQSAPAGRTDVRVLDMSDMGCFQRSGRARREFWLLDFAVGRVVAEDSSRAPSLDEGGAG